eukprot:5747729-Lingulodinium_polyedra.AAC.1
MASYSRWIPREHREGRRSRSREPPRSGAPRRRGGRFGVSFPGRADGGERWVAGFGGRVAQIAPNQP